MKVLRKGCGWSEEIQCSNPDCQSRLLVGRGDVFRVVIERHEIDDDYYDAFRCPECQYDTIVTAKLPFTPEIKSLDHDD